MIAAGLVVALVVLFVLIAIWLAVDCAKHVYRPRNRYRRDVLPPPSRDSLRRWTVAER